MGKHSHIPRILFSRTLFVVLVSVLLIFSFSMLREVRRKQTIREEITILGEELVAMEQDTSQLENLIAYLKTDEYVELEAKKRLGLKKTGENVILVTEAEAAVVEQRIVSDVEVSNWQLWWRYFFN